MGLLTSMQRNGVRVLVPSWVSGEDEPSWKSFETSDRLAEGDLRQVVETGSTVVIVPGVGFDHSGTRLGRGAGFYDRALKYLRFLGPVAIVGIGFDVQIVASLPSEEWDQRMDVVVSETLLLGTPTSLESSLGGMVRG